ncbi:hypothetical protein Hanom_Chr17g01577481 [Helianthus anomalus]
MWNCFINGYIAFTREVDGRILVHLYEKMEESDKLMYDVEKKALAAIKTSMPFEIKRIFNNCWTSRELWEALENIIRVIQDRVQAIVLL